MRARVAAVFALASACAGDEGFCILRFICFTRWTHGYATWTAGFLGLPTWPVDVAARVTDMAELGLDSLKVELADNLRDELENTLSAGGSIMDAASVTFAFMDKEGTVAGLLKL